MWVPCDTVTPWHTVRVTFDYATVNVSVRLHLGLCDTITVRLLLPAGLEPVTTYGPTDSVQGYAIEPKTV